jgi:hypothetical protein
LYGVEWPATINATLSKPLCVNQAKELAYRTCSDGQWGPEPVCSSVQPEKLPECPEGLIDNGSVCYTLTPKSSFPSDCPFNNLMSFPLYKNMIIYKKIAPVWMPVRRNVTHGLEFLQWIEQSTLYKTDFNGTIFYEDEIKDKDCLLYYNNSYMVAVSCDEKHSAVCAYDKSNLWSNQLCGTTNSFQSVFAPKSACLYQSYDRDSCPQAEFIEPYQNNVFSWLTNTTFLIGLNKTQRGRYVWSSSAKEINYTFWSRDVVYDDTHWYGGLTSSGWVLKQDLYWSVLCQKAAEEYFPSLELRGNQNELTLTVVQPRGLKWYNSDVLVNCFTNAYPTSLLFRYDITSTNTTTDKNLYTFTPYAYVSGDYWCEAFGIVDSEVIRSNVVSFKHVMSESAEYIAILQVKYLEGINPLSSAIMGLIEEYVFPTLDKIEHLKTYYVSRIMKIIDVDEVSRQVVVNLRFSPRTKINVSVEDEYIIMRKSIDSLDFDQANVTNFLIADYCLTETWSNVRWPTTQAGSGVLPSNDYCFQSDGTNLQRLCIDDFIDGARWSTDEDCTVPTFSTVTDQILSFLDNWDVSISDIAQFSTDYKLFNAFDIYLMGIVISGVVSPYGFDNSLMRIATSGDTELSDFAEIIDNLLKVEKSVLRESQLKMRATDALLEMMNDGLISSHFGYNEFEVKNDRFVFFRVKPYVYVQSSASNGIIVQSVGNEQITTKLIGPNSPEQIMNYENLESAVWLNSDQLMPQPVTRTQQVEQIVFTLFLDDGLFIEALNTSKNVTKIFGVSIPALVSYDGPVWILHRINSDGYKMQTCEYWNYDIELKRGSWESDGEFQIISNFSICKYNRRGYLAIALTDIDDVTELLTIIFQSNSTVSEKMSKLLILSQRYREFTSIDVYLVGQILEQVSPSVDIDLDILVRIISNMHKVKSDVLSQSQKEYAATDLILRYVDVIMQNNNQSNVWFSAENFMLLIYDFDETNFTGFALLNVNHSLRPEILEGDANILDLLEYDNLDSAVLLSSKLKNQTEDSAKVVLTVYYNDALFNEKKPREESISKIFGVVLPVSADYEGPVSVYHKVTKNDSHGECAYWNYDESTPGLWKDDSDSLDLTPLVLCKYWHTTHFGLLLLDDDKYDDAVLDWITAINCTISFLGMCVIVLTAILFQKWRNKVGNQLLLHFVLSSMLQLLLFYVSSTVSQSDNVGCTFTGVLLHYSIISQFCWMLVIAILQFKRFVVVFGGHSEYLQLKSCLFAWGCPLIPVLGVLVFDADSYVSGKVGLCYPSGYGLYLGVWLPICMALMINGFIFAYIVNNVTQKRIECTHFGTDDVIYHWILAFFLFFMLGMTWIFGFLAELDFGVVFEYFFCTLATLQGFVMFLFFILFNKNTRYFYTQLIKLKYYTKNF